MRNVFDQYSQPENKLTHALACCLHEDRRLLRSFVKRYAGECPPVQKLTVIEQSLPGEKQADEEEATWRGLPDLWIHDSERWSLIVESKVQAPVSSDQLRRHRATANRRGFDNHVLLAISPETPPARSLGGVKHVLWTDVYKWLRWHHSASEWALRMSNYMEALEAHMIADGYLAHGSLTTFSGINFTPESPWNYPEAKRLLGLALDQLSKRADLRRLGIDANAGRRSAITGTHGAAVWDYLLLTPPGKPLGFTAFPHLTLSIGRDDTMARLTVPNGLATPHRRNLLASGRERFETCIRQVTTNLENELRDAPEARPRLILQQQHFPHRRAAGVNDAHLEYDPRTAFRQKAEAGASKVKLQPQWLELTYSLLENKRSNMQFAIGAIFPNGCKALQSEKALDHFANAWIACRPLLDLMLQN